jgi:hypothetical protein
MTKVRYLTRMIPVFLGLTAAVSMAHAQAGPVFAYFGAGSAYASSNGQQIDTFGDGNLYNTPKLGGTFLDFGAGIMFTDHFGAGGEFSWRATQGNYAGLKYRPLFYDFDGIWQPFKSKRITPELRAGIGGVSVRYYYNSQYCDQFAGCSTSNQYLESSRHFQVNFAAAARVHITPHVFLRPAIDVHYVNNFFQFGSNWVPEYTLSVGYAFGNSE